MELLVTMSFPDRDEEIRERFGKLLLESLPRISPECMQAYIDDPERLARSLKDLNRGLDLDWKGTFQSLGLASEYDRIGIQNTYPGYFAGGTGFGLFCMLPQVSSGLLVSTLRRIGVEVSLISWSLGFQDPEDIDLDCSFFETVRVNGDRPYIYCMESGHEVPPEYLGKDALETSRFVAEKNSKDKIFNRGAVTLREALLLQLAYRVTFGFGIHCNVKTKVLCAGSRHHNGLVPVIWGTPRENGDKVRIAFAPSHFSQPELGMRFATHINEPGT